jgi:hypothetical protein
MSLDLELCLSQRSDLIIPVLERVFALRPAVPEKTHPPIIAHTVGVAPVVKLNFLVGSQDREEALRRDLIVAGELMLDDVFARSPWHKESLISRTLHSVPARLEIYAKCGHVDEADWFERRGVPRREIALHRSTTEAVRNLQLDARGLKSLLPLLVARMYSGDIAAGVGRLHARAKRLSAKDRAWLEMRLTHLRKQGLLFSPYRDPKSEDLSCLTVLEGGIAYIADAARVSPGIAIRCLLGQLGYTQLEQEYLVEIGLAIRDGAAPVRPVA